MGKWIHGMKGTRTYRAWKDMKYRCDNENNSAYSYYGGRGITYDPRWSDFREFFKDIGIIPDDLQMDRIDNNKGYFKENIRFATKSLNMANRRFGKNNFGCMFKRGAFEVRIGIEGTRYHLGRFKTKEEANAEYFKIYREWYGSDPVINPIHTTPN